MTRINSLLARICRVAVAVNAPHVSIVLRLSNIIMVIKCMYVCVYIVKLLEEAFEATTKRDVYPQDESEYLSHSTRM